MGPDMGYRAVSQPRQIVQDPVGRGVEPDTTPDCLDSPLPDSLDLLQIGIWDIPKLGAVKYIFLRVVFLEDDKKEFCRRQIVPQSGVFPGLPAQLDKIEWRERHTFFDLAVPLHPDSLGDDVGALEFLRRCRFPLYPQHRGEEQLVQLFRTSGDLEMMHQLALGHPHIWPQLLDDMLLEGLRFQEPPVLDDALARAVPEDIGVEYPRHVRGLQRIRPLLGFDW